MEGSRYCLWRYPKESHDDIRDSQKQWQWGPWTHFINIQILERDDNLDAKESGELANVRSRGMLEWESLRF